MFTGNVNNLFVMSSKNGHVELVKLLMADSRVDPGIQNNYAIQYASENGHTEAVKLLLKDPRVDPEANCNHAIRLASRNGHAEVVKLLLEYSRLDPSVHNNYAIIYAAENGHTEVVKLLLKDPRVDPAADGQYAIRLAAYRGHIEVMKILLADPRVDPVGNKLCITHDDLTTHEDPEVNCTIASAILKGYDEIVILLLSSLKYKFNADTYQKVLIDIRFISPADYKIPENINEMLIGHIIKYQWYLKEFLREHLTVDLASQINHTLVSK